MDMTDHTHLNVTNSYATNMTHSVTWITYKHASIHCSQNVINNYSLQTNEWTNEHA